MGETFSAESGLLISQFNQNLLQVNRVNTVFLSVKYCILVLSILRVREKQDTQPIERARSSFLLAGVRPDIWDFNVCLPLCFLQAS